MHDLSESFFWVGYIYHKMLLVVDAMTFKVFPSLTNYYQVFSLKTK